MTKNVVFVGGQGQLAQCFQRWWQPLGDQLHSIDRDDWDEADTLLSQADAVIISVPIQHTDAIIATVAPKLSTHCILADFTSIKVGPVSTMLTQHTGPVVGLHPMFGPTVSQANGQTLAVCPGRDADATTWLLSRFTTLGLHCHTLTAQAHDRAMDFIQGLEHFTTIALGSFLREQNVDMDTLLALASPIYRTKLNLIGRIFDQDPALYADIVTASATRRDTIETFLNFTQHLAHHADRDALIDTFTQTAEWLGDFTTQAQHDTDILLEPRETTDERP